MLSIHCIITFWQQEGLRNGIKWSQISAVYDEGTKHILTLFKKRSRKYSGEGGLSEKVHFGSNMVTKLLLLTHK